MPEAWDIVPCVPLKTGARQHFTYHEPPDTPLAPGLLVRVPFGRRTVQGLVWRRASGRVHRSLKAALGVVRDQPLFRTEALHALERLADASLESLGLIAKAAVSVRRPASAFNLPKLTRLRSSSFGGQAEKLRQSKRRGRFSVRVSWVPAADVLPDHISGQFLILVPELVIGHRVVTLLEQRKIPAALFAQGLRVRDRRAVVERLAAGEPLAVVATHAGIFLPLPALAHIMVIEAAIESHRQWDLHPRYDARVGAALLAQERGVPLTLQSSLPCLDLTLLDQIEGKRQKAKGKTPSPISYKLKAKSWRIAPRAPSDPLLLPETLKAIRDVLDRGGRALLFHDIVGTERVFVCESCGHTLRCASCQGILERHGAVLRCRVCGLLPDQVPHFCPRCKSPHLRPRRIGTTTLAEDLQRQFPDATVVRADRETLPRTSTTTPSAVPAASITVMTERGFVALGEQRYDLLAVLEADRLLEDLAPDAEERFLHVLTRLAGYGSARAPFHVQTTHPNLRSVRALADGDLSAWVQQELEDRQALAYPPYAALLRLEQVFPSEPRAARAVEELNNRLKATSYKLKAGHRLVGLPPRVRAELLLRGRLTELQRAAPSLTSGWSADPIVPLSVLAQKTSDVGRSSIIGS